MIQCQKEILGWARTILIEVICYLFDPRPFFFWNLSMVIWNQFFFLGKICTHISLNIEIV